LRSKKGEEKCVLQVVCVSASGVVPLAYNPSYVGGIRKITQVSPWAKTRPYLKLKQKEYGDVGQEIEHLPSKFKALSSNPSTAKK
jgi:hypothetical protein